MEESRSACSILSSRLKPTGERERERERERESESLGRRRRR